MIPNSNTPYDENDLFAFAFLGKQGDFDKKLAYLANHMAEDEPWGDEEDNIRILRNYILKTFNRVNKQKKILYSQDGQFCCSNTGLLDANGKEIVMIFSKNIYVDEIQLREWYFNGFRIISDRDYIETFGSIVPEMATYTDKYEDFYFNPNINITVNTEHILDDNWERVSTEIPLPKNIVKLMLPGVLETARKKAKRNLHLVIPQFYMDKIGFLMPLKFPIDDNKYVTMALAIEKINDGLYRGNTIYNLQDAYLKARLLMKPESGWITKFRK